MIDVTRKVSFGHPEGESLSLLSCLCGETFDYYDFMIGIYDDMAKACVCGRKYVFENKVTIYQVVDK
jgi:hypothetical protein